MRPTEFAVAGAPVERLGEDAHFLRIPGLHLHAERLDAELHAAGLRPSAIVFLSKHKAASARPALTVHPIGNCGAAAYGGAPGRLSPCAPALQSELLRALRREADAARYAGEVTFEVTHHGPLLATPACFLELGSSEAQWDDAKGGAVVAAALLHVLARPLPAYPIAVGLGGAHYGPRFTEAVLTRRVHIGHMIPNHAMEDLSEPAPLLAEAMRATTGASGVYAHRKSMEKGSLDAWRAAAAAQGVPWLDSGAWPELGATFPRPG